MIADGTKSLYSMTVSSPLSPAPFFLFIKTKKNSRKLK